MPLTATSTFRPQFEMALAIFIDKKIGLAYCPFGKKFFAWHFILNENILFWLTISCQNLFVFYVSVFSQIFTQKLKLRPKVSDLSNL